MAEKEEINYGVVVTRNKYSSWQYVYSARIIRREYFERMHLGFDAY